MSKLSKKAGEKVLCVVTTLAQKNISGSNAWGWPPDCAGLFYQHKRPDDLRKEKK